MKITEFKFNNEQDMDAAEEILTKIRESKPAPRFQSRSYVAVALGEEEARDLRGEMERRGIFFEVALESCLPDEHFVNA